MSGTVSRGRRAAFACSVAGVMAGCSPWGDDPHGLVVATTWPVAARVACESAFRAEGGNRPITWVELGGHRWLDACDRRGGVDLILGGPVRNMRRLADAGRLDPIAADDLAPWHQADRPRSSASSLTTPPGDPADPRDDSVALAAAQSIIEAEGWTRGYETLVRRAVGLRAGAKESPPGPLHPREAVGLVRNGPHPDQARRFVTALTRQGWVRPPLPDAMLAARADDLLADLLGAVLVDARNERRDAQVALDVADHPAIAEAAVGEIPPWPPASVARLRADPAGRALADALAEQVAPDDEAEEWLEYSWRRPKRPIDLALLREICQANGGRLVREPRFRAWLRGEWTAWTQQLYRRVARLAGGYRPS